MASVDGQLTLTEFLLARIAEDEAAALAVPPLEHNFDMGGHRQDERFVFVRVLPSSADGLGNWSPHRAGTAHGTHFSRWTPARVLAEVEAKRRIVADHYPIDPCDAHDARFQTVLCDTLRLLALPYADHPDYDPEWRP